MKFDKEFNQTRVKLSKIIQLNVNSERQTRTECFHTRSKSTLTSWFSIKDATPPPKKNNNLPTPQKTTTKIKQTKQKQKTKNKKQAKTKQKRTISPPKKTTKNNERTNERTNEPTNQPTKQTNKQTNKQKSPVSGAKITLIVFPERGKTPPTKSSSWFGGNLNHLRVNTDQPILVSLLLHPQQSNCQTLNDS